MPKFTSDEEVSSWFEYHPPKTPIVIQAHTDIRAGFRELALRLNNLLPEGPDKKETLRALRRTMYDANACVAVAQDVYRDVPEVNLGERRRLIDPNMTAADAEEIASQFRVTKEPQDAVRRCEVCGRESH